MADFKVVAGRLEGLWNEGMAQAETEGRVAGEAAAQERCLQVAEVLAGEWDEGAVDGNGFVSRQAAPFVQELRKRLSVPALPEFPAPDAQMLDVLRRERDARKAEEARQQAVDVAAQEEKGKQALDRAHDA